MNKFLIVGIFVSMLVGFGCTADTSPLLPDGGVDVDVITSGPVVPEDHVSGCWFDSLTRVHKDGDTNTLCELRGEGQDVACADLCDASALETYDECGRVDRCVELQWVYDDDPLTEDQGCWVCVEGCVNERDRTVDGFNECRLPEDQVSID